MKVLYQQAGDLTTLRCCISWQVTSQREGAVSAGRKRHNVKGLYQQAADVKTLRGCISRQVLTQNALYAMTEHVLLSGQHWR